jgi:hypothetical protein
MSRCTDFFWPTLEKPKPAELAHDDASEAADIAAARRAGWAQSPELALEEARRLADSEEDRRRATEGKASTYLLFAAAFAAALIPFLPGILESKTGSAPRWLIAIILIVATLYLMAAGIWAFRALRVGTFHRPGVAELAQIWRHSSPARALIRETFALARMNYRAVNEKVSCIKIAHEFMARSFIAFGVLVVVEAGWEAVHSVTNTHGGQVVTGTDGPSKPGENGATESAPHAHGGSPSTIPPSVKPPPSPTASGAIKPGTDLPAKPAANVGATNPETNAPVTPGANGLTSPAGSPPRKQ